MSSPVGLTDPSTLVDLQMAADLLLTFSASVIAVLLFDYANKKADDSARKGCYITASFFCGMGLMNVIDIWCLTTGHTAITVYLNLGVAILATIGSVIMIKMHPHSPDMRIASRLERRNRELEQENLRFAKERTNAIDMAKESAIFLANVSQEVRSTLSVVVGLQETVASAKSPSSEQRQFSNAVSDSATTLMSLLTDIQDMSSIQAGNAQLVTLPLSIDSVIHDAIKHCSESARKKKLFLNTDIDPAIPDRLMGDSRRISQILAHLIGNAVKWTDKGGITVRAALTDGGTSNTVVVRFSVKDTGTPLHEDDRAEIFAPRSYEGASGRRSGDTALGLYMSKLLVDIMGGTIDIETAKGQGPTFWFSLNLATPDLVDSKR